MHWKHDVFKIWIKQFVNTFAEKYLLLCAIQLNKCIAYNVLHLNSAPDADTSFHKGKKYSRISIMFVSCKKSSFGCLWIGHHVIFCFFIEVNFCMIAIICFESMLYNFIFYRMHRKNKVKHMQKDIFLC